MPVTTAGTFTKRDINSVIESAIASLRLQFGPEVDVTPSGVFRKLLEAGFALPLIETEDDMDFIYSQIFFESAIGENLEKLLEPFGYARLLAENSEGIVNVTFTGALSTPPEVDPFFPSGSINFFDSAGRKYILNSDVSVDGTAAVELPVSAVQLGSLGNVAADGIVAVSFNNTAVQTRWNANVDTFTNDVEFAGGRNRETDIQLRRRVRNSLASSETASVGGITTALLTVPGVSGVSIIENATMIGGTESPVFNSTETGTASATTLDSSGDKLAQTMVIADRRWVQHFTAKLNSDTDLVATVRVETDAAGEPSGTLADSALALSAFDFDGTSLSSGTFTNGAFLDPGTYHLVFTWESGTGVFDGGTGGTADQVNADTGGGYGLDANIENMNASLIGGVPPKSFRAYVTGGTSDAVAQKIWNTKAGGIYSDGITSGTAVDLGDDNHTIYFDRPVQIGLVFTATVTFSEDFTGDEDTIKDAIIEYIGGVTSELVSAGGLAVEERAIRHEVVSRLLDDDIISGLVDVTELRLGLKSSFPTPASLTATEVVNLTPAIGEEFLIEDASTDITVTLVADS